VTVWRNRLGQVRAVWVVGLFTVCAGVLVPVLQGLFELVGLIRGPMLLGSSEGWAAGLVTCVPALVATALTVRVTREQVDSALVDRRSDLRLGVGAGVVALTVSVLGSLLAGEVHLSGSSDGALKSLLFQVLLFVPGGIAEELMLRGVAFRALVRGLGTWGALGLSAVIFGGLHLMNPNASLAAAANVALVGVWFGLLALRRSLWASSAAHIAWNVTQGGVFGLPVSGFPPEASLLGGRWSSQGGFWSGGDFGPEAAGLTTVVLLVACGLTARFLRARAG
jgi:hypothetical protein